MTCMHEDEVNIINECNWIHYILNTYERTKLLNSHHYPILHGCINTQNDRAKFNNFNILLDSRCTSKIIMRILIAKLNPERDTVMQWHTHEGNITTNLKVKIDFTLPELRATKIVTWNFHVDESAKGRYEMILGINLLT